VLTLITRGREYYASELAGNGACAALASVTLAPASVSASAAEALLQVQEVLLTCSARGRALSDLNGLVEKKKATEIEEREWRPRAISSLRLVAALLAFGIRNLHRRQLARPVQPGQAGAIAAISLHPVARSLWDERRRLHDAFVPRPDAPLGSIRS